MAKIKVTPEVRTLLIEQAALFEQFDGLTATLADRSTSDVDALTTGAEREYVKGRICGLAYRINMAAIGKSPS